MSTVDWRHSAAAEAVSLSNCSDAVDVVVAWYVVPLVFFTWKRFWKTHRNQDAQDASWEPVNGV